MPSPWYILAAVAYGAFIVLVCLVAAIANDDEKAWCPHCVDLCDSILDSEGE